MENVENRANDVKLNGISPKFLSLVSLFQCMSNSTHGALPDSVLCTGSGCTSFHGARLSSP